MTCVLPRPTSSNSAAARCAACRTASEIPDLTNDANLRGKSCAYQMPELSTKPLPSDRREYVSRERPPLRQAGVSSVWPFCGPTSPSRAAARPCLVREWASCMEGAWNTLPQASTARHWEAVFVPIYTPSGPHALLLLQAMDFCLSAAGNSARTTTTLFGRRTAVHSACACRYLDGAVAASRRPLNYCTPDATYPTAAQTLPPAIATSADRKTLGPFEACNTWTHTFQLPEVASRALHLALGFLCQRRSRSSNDLTAR